MSFKAMESAGEKSPAKPKIIASAARPPPCPQPPRPRDARA